MITHGERVRPLSHMVLVCSSSHFCEAGTTTLTSFQLRCSLSERTNDRMKGDSLSDGGPSSFVTTTLGGARVAVVLIAEWMGLFARGVRPRPRRLGPPPAWNGCRRRRSSLSPAILNIAQGANAVDSKS